MVEEPGADRERERDRASNADPGLAPKWQRRSLLGAMVVLPVATIVSGVNRLLSPSDDATATPTVPPASPPPTIPPTTPPTTTPVATTTTAADGPAAAPTFVSIAEENALPGTRDWQVPQQPAAWDKVRGYASRTSVAAGESFGVFVTTAAAGFTVTAYRIGHYGGLGGREIWTSGPLPGVQQAAPRVDRATNCRDAPWRPSVTVTTDASWRPGSYLLKLVSDDGGQSQIPLVVRDDDRASAVHIQHDVTTWQAYNKWGGASLYEGQGGRSTVVSFDRPYDMSGSGNFLGGVFEIASLVESLGLDVTYSTSLDTHARPELVGRHQVWISPAHDEYWSPEMRDGVEHARDAGLNLMFLGANCMFRRIRLADSPLGPNRLVINYRSARKDPLNGIDPARVTTSWREPPAARPESWITGTFYESNPVKADMVIVDADAWMFAGTGVANGDHWVDLVGNEYDRVTPERPTPHDIQVLAHSPVQIRGKSSFADMTYYTIDSGAGVFSAGSIWFERHVGPGGTGTDAQISKVVANLLDVFSRGPAGLVHPAVRNLDRFGIRPGYVPPVERGADDASADETARKR